MRHFIAICLLAPAVCLAQSRPASDPTSAQHAEVRRAVLDYLEGFYEGDTAKLVRGLRPEMFKYGFWKAKDAPKYEGEKMSYDEAIAYARRFKADKRTTPATAPREVTIYEVQDQTASAKVRAWWGTDYVLLGKYDGRWMISHILWQSPPPPAP
ncbi:MAG TPA: nuclear transport factor 2 family protein [Gemmatimonadaceae bacterium]